MKLGSCLCVSRVAILFFFLVTLRLAQSQELPISILSPKRVGADARFLTDAARQAPPAAIAISKSDPIGNTHTFTALVRDSDGYQDVRNLYLIFNSALRGDQGCFLHINLQDGRVSLANDAASDWTATPTPFGAARVLTNSSCSLDTSKVTAQPKAQQLSALEYQITLPITFSQTFSGVKNVYGLAEDKGGNTLAWAQVGTYTFGTSQSPQISALTAPIVGSGNAMQVVQPTFVFARGGASDELTKAYILVNASLSAPNGCLVEFDLIAGTVRLANDAASNWLPQSGALGRNAAQTFSSQFGNSNCEVTADSSLTPAANASSYTLVTFLKLKQFAAGTSRKFFAFVEAKSGRNSGWQEFETVNGPAAVTPSLLPSLQASQDSAAPKGIDYSGTRQQLNNGSNGYFSFTVGDSNGPADIATVYLLVASSLTAGKFCLLEHDTRTNSVRLTDSAGSAWLPWQVLGLGSRLSQSNAECDLLDFGANSNDPTYAAYYTEQRQSSSSPGVKKMYGAAVDISGKSSGWVDLGTWDVPGKVAPSVAVPVVTQLAPNSFRLMVRVTDRNGDKDLKAVRLLIGNGTGTTSNVCSIEFAEARNERGVYLADDAGNVNPNSGLQLLYDPSGYRRNSQCLISNPSFSYVNSTTAFEYEVTVQFFSTFTGNKMVYSMAEDFAGNTSSWSPGAALQIGTVSLAAGEIQSARVTGGSSAAPELALSVLIPINLDPDSTYDVLIGASTAPQGTCWARFIPRLNAWQLNNEEGSTLVTPANYGPDATVTNSRCSFKSGFGRSFVFRTGALNALPIGFQFTPQFTGNQKLFVRSADSTGNTTGWKELLSFSIPGPTAPQVSQFTVSQFVRGSAFYASIRYSDNLSGTYLKDAYLLINDRLSAASGCFLWFDVKSDTLRLANDAGDNWSPDAIPMNTWPNSRLSPFLENSFCKVVPVNSGKASWYQVYVNILFKGGFQGSKTYFANVTNLAGLSSGWIEAGTPIQVPASAAPVMLTQPGSVRGGGSSGRIRIQANDPDNILDVRSVTLLLGSSPTDTTACQMNYRFDDGVASLRDGNGGTLTGSIGSTTAALGNQNCRFNLIRTGASTDANLTYVAVDFAFQLNYLQARQLKVFAQATDTSGATSGWVEVGTWSADGQPGPSMTVVSPIPKIMTKQSTQTLSLRLNDPNGAADLRTLYLITKAEASNVASCFVQVNLAAREVRLANDAANNWLSIVGGLNTPISGLGNSQCSISSVQTQTSAANPNETIVNFQLSYASGFTGLKFISAFVDDSTGANSDWLNLETVEIK